MVEKLKNNVANNNDENCFLKTVSKVTGVTANNLSLVSHYSVSLYIVQQQ